MELGDVLRRQGGVVSLAQARACGLSERTVQRRVSGRRRLHPGVYLADGHDLDDRGRVRAAALWLAEGTLSGRAAAFWHGLPTGHPPRWRSRCHPACTAHHEPVCRSGGARSGLETGSVGTGSPSPPAR
ncbi:type IV toxin-antitoxin system AbiEi family antitoxin domain-containing protein [Pseudonocardia oroxyli]|uniref:type IV toxin-antitoxin system AbiEi family antitoxin domain-containing protein n=1 Tax=Pseudonocardia oroxyli TaxID=366584 RepID=UPI00115F927A|nr:type IV toxin-antitoxin system AbiEi family antitoxin domain-containing protein [Pseudonocardia oroxyli]